MTTAMKRPADLTYWVNDRPPVLTAIFLGLQQIFGVAIYLVLVSFIGQIAHASAGTIVSMISMALIVMGVIALIQAWGKWGLGAGFLMTNAPAVTFFSVSVVAAAHGLGVLFGLTLFAGVCEAVFSRFLKHLRGLFPPVVTGLTFCGLGLSVGLMALRHLIGGTISLQSTHYQYELLTFAITLVIMLVLSVWARGFLKLLCLMIGLIIGSIIGYFLGLFNPQGLDHLRHAAIFAIPNLGYIHYSFSWQLLPVFLIAATAASLRTLGVSVMCQQFNNANWQQTDLKSAKGGVLADALAVFLGGLSGTMAIGVSPSAVGITKASGATSRYIALAVGGFCILFGFLPKIAALFLALPTAVISAGLVVTGSIMLVGGIRIIATQPLDMRRTYIIGISVFLTLSPALFPDFYSRLPMVLQNISHSMLATIALSAIILNLVFQIGRRQQIAVKGGESIPSESALLEKTKALGVDNKIAKADINLVHNLLLHIENNALNRSPFHVQLAYNEINLTVEISYQGLLPRLTQAPADAKELFEDWVSMEGLARMYQGVVPDKYKTRSVDGKCYIQLVFAQL